MMVSLPVILSVLPFGKLADQLVARYMELPNLIHHGRSSEPKAMKKKREKHHLNGVDLAKSDASLSTAEKGTLLVVLGKKNETKTRLKKVSTGRSGLNWTRPGPCK